MHAWEAIQKTLSYIEVHLGEELSIEALAQQAALSPFYYQRLFTRLVKRPVREYIKLRRLAGASAALAAHREKKIVDVAMESGFASHESFTRAFKEAYGLTPEEFRAAPLPLNQFDKPDLLLGYVTVDEGVPLISDGLVLEFDRRTLEAPITFWGFTDHVPIEGQMPLGEGTGVDVPGEVWGRFHREKHRLPRLENGRELGVAYLGDAPAGSFTYFAGAEVAPGARTKEFAIYSLPAREYIVCGFAAEDFHELTTVAINKAVKYSAGWLEKHGYSMEEYSPEVYYDSTPEGSYMELWMPYLIKR